jgi:hypothetical protein
MNTVPTGSPLAPTNACAVVNVGSYQHPQLAFTTRGSRRIQTLGDNGTAIGFGNTTAAFFSLAAAPAFISTPTPIGSIETNRRVPMQVQVTGTLGEQIANAPVVFSLARISSVNEILAVTPTPGETVAVAQPPIDRLALVFDFEVLEGGVPLTETTHYTVNEALGEITFVAPKPEVGMVYTATYAHPAAPATPPHGTLVDSAVTTDIDGFAQARVLYPDDADLIGQVDQLDAETPT